MADVVMTLVVTAWSILGAWLLRPCLLAWALAAQAFPPPPLIETRILCIT